MSRLNFTFNKETVVPRKQRTELLVRIRSIRVQEKLVSWENWVRTNNWKKHLKLKWFAWQMICLDPCWEFLYRRKRIVVSVTLLLLRDFRLIVAGRNLVFLKQILVLKARREALRVYVRVLRTPNFLWKISDRHSTLRSNLYLLFSLFTTKFSSKQKHSNFIQLTKLNF